MMEKEIESLIAHVARLHGKFQDEVWKCIYELSKKYIKTDE